MNKEVLDIGIFVVSALSALGVLASAIYAAKAANAAKRATDLNLQMFEEQKQEKERIRKAAFQSESSKLHRAINIFHPYFLSEKAKTVDEKRKLAFDLKPILKLCQEKLENVNASVFSTENQSNIHYIQMNIGFRIAELDKISSSDDPELDNIYLQMYGLNMIIIDYLQSTSLQENELIK